MRKHIILFFSALLFLYACKEGNATKDIIKRDVMVRLLADVHLVDGSLATQPNGDSLYRFGTGRYLYLFKQYHTDSAQFKNSMKFYAAQPEIMVKMYEDIEKILQAKLDSMNKIVADENEITRKRTAALQRKADKMKKDSIALKMKNDRDKIKKDSVNKASGIKPAGKHKKPKKKLKNLHLQ
ncbi:DUF4296 domain-containing protein [Mucilaginibacter sp. UR6-11]|uniref:DUF4296 domain-containing protein n=1 Tax=Mucilaginibacter sp. UR6-11 TaxID=1435644 RepID=UPI001E46A423|nr:DUF4296 domain-containing protein [Mucilaginibacter sp. UR6-11]MCC8426261.1 DUF4296 domain-containing protein [Mucilaginibacter sp. UR6-11]